MISKIVPMFLGNRLCGGSSSLPNERGKKALVKSRVRTCDLGNWHLDTLLFFSSYRPLGDLAGDILQIYWIQSSRLTLQVNEWKSKRSAIGPSKYMRVKVDEA